MSRESTGTHDSEHEHIQPFDANYGLASMLQARSITSRMVGDFYVMNVTGMPSLDLVAAITHSPSATWLCSKRGVVRGSPSPASLLQHDPAWLIRIDGPVEDRDVQAIQTAAMRGDDLLAFEIRADVAMYFQRHAIRISTRQSDTRAALASAVLRRHAADVLGRPPTLVPAPEVDVAGMLLREGGMLLRGVETQCWPGFVDIGIADPCHEGSPAVRSAILDRVTGRWHTD